MAKSGLAVGAVVGGGVLFLLLASKSKKADAAEPGTPQLPDPNDPHTQYQSGFEQQMRAQADQAVRDTMAENTPLGPTAVVSPELSLATMAENTPLGPSYSPHAPSIPLQPVTAEPIRQFDIPAPTMPPIDVHADASNVLTPATPAPIPTAAAGQRSDKTAATELLAYVVPILKAKRGAELGTKGAPNSFVKAAQADMGVAADGIYGPTTRTRGKQLLGVTFPARV